MRRAVKTSACKKIPENLNVPCFHLTFQTIINLEVLTSTDRVTDSWSRSAWTLRHSAQNNLSVVAGICNKYGWCEAPWGNPFAKILAISVSQAVQTMQFHVNHICDYYPSTKIKPIPLKIEHE